MSVVLGTNKENDGKPECADQVYCCFQPVSLSFKRDNLTEILTLKALNIFIKKHGNQRVFIDLK